MTKKEILKELEETAKKLSYEVSYEALKKTGPFVKSGFVKLNDRKIILIDKELNVNMKVDVMLNILHTENLEEVYVKPFVKDMILNFK